MSKSGMRRTVRCVCACLALMTTLAGAPRQGFAGQPPKAPEGFVAWDEDTEARKPSPTGQDETGRLWDVLTMTRHAIRATHRTRRGVVQVLRVPPTGRTVRPQLATLHLVAGPGDHGEPVLTLMLPWED